MRNIRAATLAAAMILPAPVSQAEDHQIGNWSLSIEKDRFDDTRSRVVAVTQQGFSAFAVRCFEKELSLAVVDPTKRYAAGAIFEVKFRSDKNPVISLSAAALDRMTIQTEANSDLVKQIRGGREVALRVKGATATFDYLFKTTKAKEALEPIVKECAPE